MPPPRRCTHRAAPWTPLIALLACLVAAPGVGGDGASTNSGYNLYAPLGSTIVSLADMGGDVAHSWDAGYPPGHAVYLLENGDLLHTGDVGEGAMNGGGKGGIVQRLAPDGRVLWQYRLSDDRTRLHHDVEPLPNGNVLMIAWERKTEAQALAAGRDPSLLNDGELWVDALFEVRPTGPTSGTVVWEWHLWDHLVQDHDPTRDNYGGVAEHPELVDLNFCGRGAIPGQADWNHTNAVDYSHELDQILLSVRQFSEIWIIDHGTSTAQAAGHSDGRYGRGGDLLYRWGNPQAYRAGTPRDQQLYNQHDAQWIADDCPGAGDILVFNNGMGRPGENYTTVDELVPPLLADGSYAQPAAGQAYLPTAPTWRYTADPPSSFYADHISGAQRLPNGNTLVCDGTHGRFFEVTAAGETVWENDVGDVEVFRVTRIQTSDARLDPLLERQGRVLLPLLLRVYSANDAA